MRIFNFHPYTDEYLGESVADQDPLDKDNWLVPAYATTIEPPVQQDGKIRVFVNGVWCYSDIVTAHEAELESEQTSQPSIAEPVDPQLSEIDIRINEINALFNFLDMKSIRPLRAVASGTQTQFDLDTIATIDAQVLDLRNELSGLMEQK